MTVYVARTHAAHRAPRRPWRTALIVAVALCGTVAAATLGPWLWHLHHDRAQLDAGQAELGRQWDITTAQVAGRPAPGGPIGRMTIPRLKLSWVLAEGVDLDSLKGAPGHFPASADVGARGNASFAGHREAGLWADLDEVKPGDAIVIETRANWFTYRVTVTRVVAATDFAEVAPTPPGMKPGRLLTLMTCWPRWPVTDPPTQRLAVHAVLERTSPADEPPSELTEGDHR